MRQALTLETSINGTMQSTTIDGHESAVDVIREHFGLTGTKLVCAGGVCGACTVMLDGKAVASCLLPASRLHGATVTTVEGVADNGELHPVQRAFLAHDGLQCGYCTPGFIVHAVDFHDRWRSEKGTSEPDRHAIAEALAGHLCRCGAYEGIYRAVAAACRGEHDEGHCPEARIDGRVKVTGEAVYTADYYPDGVLEAVIVRAPIAAGVVAALPDDAAEYLIDLLDEDRTVRWAGQPIAAVAASSLGEARRIAAKLPLNIKNHPFVIDPGEAIRDGAPTVYADKQARKSAPNAAEGPIPPARWSGNVRGPTPVPILGTLAKRRLRKAREIGAAGVVDLHVGTSPQLHSSFEPHGTVADWSDPDLLRVWTSTQAVDEIVHQLSDRYDLKPEQIEVTADFIGGGFGSKLSMTVDMRAAVELSRLARRPVRLILDRREELTATGNRPGSSTDISILVSNEGALKAMVVDAHNHAGIAVNGIGGMLCTLLYGRSPRVAYDRDVLTHAPPGTPFRGPYGPTYAWALEQAVDQAAHQLKRDPIALRQGWDGNQKRQALYRWGAELPVWKNRLQTGSQSGRVRRGVGVAAANWIYMVDPDTEVVVSVESGRLVATTASQDIGTGSKTLLARAVGSVFGLDPGEVVVRMGKAGLGQVHGPTSGGSRATASIWSTAVEAANQLKQNIGITVSSEHDGKSAKARRGGDKGIRPMPFTMAGVQIGRGFSAALHIAEVEVDTLTGKTRVLSVHGGIAAGIAHNRTLATSQCEGAIIQGIGLALYENQILDPHSGLTLTCNLEDYRIPQLGDMPEITIHFHEPGWDHVPGGGVGLGEVSTISPAAAVANAIFNATGWRPTQAPVRPDRMLEGLQ